MILCYRTGWGWSLKSNLSLSYICHFDRKGTPFIYLLLTNGTLFTYISTGEIYCSRYILGSRGIGGRVRENNAYCFLLRMAHLLIFIHNGGIGKGTIQPRLKMVLIFLVTKVFQKGTMFKCGLSNYLTLT